MPSRNRSRSRSTELPPEEAARQHALRLLAGRDYTVARLHGKLMERGYGEGAVCTVLSTLESEGLLGDRRYAERFAEAAMASGRCFGPRLKLELRRRGVPDGVIAEVLAPLLSERDEEDDVQGLVRRRFPDFSCATATDREKRRVIGFLQRRGLPIAAIVRVLREYDPDC